MGEYVEPVLVGKDGTVRCPRCSATSFSSKRNPKELLGYGIWFGIGVVFTPKRLQCNGCGRYFKPATKR
ncbi:MAG: hypothetical protein WB797_02370 [Nocardioides sp.]